MALSTDAWSESADGVRLRIRLTPKGGRDALDGLAQLDDGQRVVKARVRAAPEDGAANAALLALLAKALGVPKSALALEQGASSRLKTVLVRRELVALSPMLDKLEQV